MFRVELFPADQGDAILIEYGEPPALHRVLVDAGTPATAARVIARLERLKAEERRFDLLVVTHVDTDHIGGVLKLLDAKLPYLHFADVWFNAWRHLDPLQPAKKKSSKLGDIDGEILGNQLDKAGWKWNHAFGGNAIGVPDEGALPVKPLPGGMKLTVLSPDLKQLLRLRGRWKQSALEAGLDPNNPDYAEHLLEKARGKGVASSLLGEAEPDVAALAASPFKSDTAIANGSTIALYAEYGDKRCLLGGDAFATVMGASIGRLLAERGWPRLPADAFKLAHHGSTGNVSNELLALVDTRRYLLSTSGAVFGHPDDQAVARVIATPTNGRKALYFNYTAATLAKNYRKKKQRDMPDWAALADPLRCDAKFPDNDATGVVLEL